ncbi:protein BRANCHLESS TRICHOME-like [Iris pallida]|uniref:Protein BRANCHLESS TRICHOME-like n=1 Tax=Iris pallida TaxID=29817 RepID=A0AAX6DHM8_IRIPA|nr:protein BRANCHLESS TRICHOME-like [Iris pallida]
MEALRQPPLRPPPLQVPAHQVEVLPPRPQQRLLRLLPRHGAGARPLGPRQRDSPHQAAQGRAGLREAHAAEVESVNRSLSRDLEEERRRRESAEEACRKLTDKIACVHDRERALPKNNATEEKVGADEVGNNSIISSTKTKTTSAATKSADGELGLQQRKEVENPHIKRGIKGLEFPRGGSCSRQWRQRRRRRRHGESAELELEGREAGVQSGVPEGPAEGAAAAAEPGRLGAHGCCTQSGDVTTVGSMHSTVNLSLIRRTNVAETFRSTPSQAFFP